MLNNLLAGVCAVAVVLLCNSKWLFLCIIMVSIAMTMLTGILKSILTSILVLYFFVVQGFALYPGFKDKIKRK